MRLPPTRSPAATAPRRVQDEARRNGRIYHASPLVAFGRNMVMRQLGAERMTARYDWLYGFKTGDEG